MAIAGVKEQDQKADELAANNSVLSNQTQKRKARLRSVRRVAFATACLLIGICVYSVLDPAIVSSASSFISRAKLWVGNVLQVNVAVDVPPPPDTGFYCIETPVTSYDLKTVDEIHATFGVTVYEPMQIPGGMKLGNVEAMVLDGDLMTVRYSYAADENSKVVFSIQPVIGEQSEPQVSFPDHAFTQTTPAGEFTVFVTGSGWWYSKMFSSAATVDINGKLDKDTFLNMLATLRVVN